MMTTAQVLMTVLIVAVITLMTRAVSFILFPSGRRVPAFIVWMSQQLPRAVMAMLMIYCLKDISLTQAPYGIPALLGVGITAVLHLWKRQMMLSIIGGTAAYMLLIRLLG